LNASSNSLLIRGGRIFDPGQGVDLVGDLFLADGVVQWLAPSRHDRKTPPDTQILDAKNLLVCPGFIDLHCHLREPGFENKETISTGVLAAVRGGFTTVCAMPNTQPPLDHPAVVEQVQRAAEREGLARLLPIGCVTVGRAGKAIVDMTDLARSGVVAFSDDGDPVADSNLMNTALNFSKELGLPIINHCQELTISKNGVAHAGWVSAYLDLPGQPASAEESMVARDIDLAELTGGKLHLAHVSTAGSVALVRMAKERGLQVTAEATPHHLVLTEEWVMLPPKGQGRNLEADESVLTSTFYDTRAKVNPPLRTEQDRLALVSGVRDGTIDIIATDHAPHSREDKECTFQEAAFGITGLETAFGLLMKLVHRGDIPMACLIQNLTLGPARVLGPAWSHLGNLNPHAVADVTIVDPHAEWIVEPEFFASKGKNTPLGGVTLKGRVVATVVSGRLVHQIKE
jgi:dihydroorotase